MTDLNWTSWSPIEEAVRIAPTAAGVYEARLREGQETVYVGSASDRKRGVSQRLHAYAVGKSPDSGLTGKAANLALTDVKFCERIARAAAGDKPWTISEIAVRALDHLGIEVRSAAAPDFRNVEATLIAGHPWDHLWNVRRR